MVSAEDVFRPHVELVLVAKRARVIELERMFPHLLVGIIQVARVIELRINKILKIGIIIIPGPGCRQQIREIQSLTLELGQVLVIEPSAHVEIIILLPFTESLHIRIQQVAISIKHLRRIITMLVYPECISAE